jgi:hypothetical protein
MPRHWWSPEIQKSMHLLNSDGWTYELKTEQSENPIMAFGKPIRKYLATRHEENLTPVGKPCRNRDGTPKSPIVREIILDSVTDICKKIGGTSDGLLDWAVAQTQLDVLAQLMPGMDYGDHLANLRFLATNFEAAKTEAKLTRSERPTMLAMARLAVRELGREPKSEISLTRLAEMLDRATPARKRSLEEAGELGTRAHEIIQVFQENGGLRYFQEGIEYEIDLSDEREEVQRAVRTFISFWQDMGLKTIATELMVADIEMGVAGTLDSLCEDPQGNLVLLDWKTSKAVRDHFLLQVTAYARMYNKAGGEWPIKAFVVRCDKVTANLQIVPVYTTKDEYLALCKQWAAQLQTHRWLKWAGKHIAKFENIPVEDQEAEPVDDSAVSQEQTEEAFNFR